MTTSHKTKWREARMRLKNRDVMTIFNRDGTTTEVEHPFSALQALHAEIARLKADIALKDKQITNQASTIEGLWNKHPEDAPKDIECDPEMPEL